ncbi:MAG: DUF3299 domain-containing protein [Steroidobacteraceae bacterium]|jgi:hypothetical protein|nr:DUF3299 domain-containing protein [Steroidobacteraceae bacterium]
MTPSSRSPRPARRTPLLAAAAVALVALAAGAPAVLPASAQTTPPRVGQPVPKPATPTPAPGKAQTLEWEELLPEDERNNFMPGPPPAVHDYLSGDGSLAAQQPMNFNVNKALEGRNVRVPGFIVPLELDEQGKVTEFFLVPYFGACIHVPPPPPNQMLFVTTPKGITLDSMYAAYWVTGRLTTRTKQTRLGAAAYTLAATDLEEYRY